MDNSGGARRSKFSPDENANDEEYEIKSGQWEAAAGYHEDSDPNRPGKPVRPHHTHLSTNLMSKGID